MSLLPDRELWNIPNILLIMFGLLIALFITHFVSIPFEEN